MAIASLVLSLVWIAGLGSLLAIIFAFIARKNIRDSRGAQTGNGIALAGLVIGIVGLLGAASLIVSIIALNYAVNESLTPTTVSMGTKVAVGDPGNTGITAATVQSVSAPVAPGPGVPAPASDKEYAVAKVGICAGASGSQNAPTDADFTLGFADGETTSSSFNPVETPDIRNINGLAPHACATGYVSFEIINGTTPTYVAYQPGLFHEYRWKTAG